MEKTKRIPQDEEQLEKAIGDVLSRDRLAADMLLDQRESAGSNGRWEYGQLTVTPGKAPGGPYLQVNDVDGVTQALLQIADFSSPEELRNELDDIHMEAADEL